VVTKLAENLPVEAVVIEPEEDTTGMFEIDEEIALPSQGHR